MRVVNTARGTVLGDRVQVADNPWTRFRGLMFRPGLPPGGGLWLQPCKQVHTFWMRFAIDAVFVDRTGTVLLALPELGRGRISPLVRRAAACLELPAGTLAATGTRAGDRLERAEPGP